jgi:hypothetical protein
VNHEEAALLLPELLRGGLSPTARSSVADHLAGCEECRALSATYDVLSATLKRAQAAGFSGHLSSHDIVIYAVRGVALSSQEEERISTHLRGCDTCRADVELTRRADRATRTGGVLPFVLRPLFASGTSARAALPAAAAVLVVLAYPAYLGFRRLPDALRRAEEQSAARGAAERQADDLRASLDRTTADLDALSGFGGAVDLNVLESIPRGGSAARIVKLRLRQPFVLVSVLPNLPPAARAEDVYRFSIDRSGGPSLWSDEMTVAQIRDRLRSAGVITFAVPAKHLAPGKFRFQVKPSGPAAGPPILEVPFEASSAE